MHYFFSFLLLLGFGNRRQQARMERDLLFRNIGIVNPETGRVENKDVLLSGGKIEAIGERLPERGLVIDGTGKYLMPGLTSAHVHVGTLRGNAIKKENYTRENILRQLTRYQEYGITQVLSMGTDQPLLFQSGLYDSLVAKKLPGAQMLSAGYGFAVKGGAPGSNFPMENLFHPQDAAAAERAVDSLAAMHVHFVKIWVDDAGPNAPKLSPDIYQSIIAAAHRRQLKVVAHAYTLNDARQLVAAGVDVLGHSIRDSLVDAPLLKAMKEKGVMYIPTLTLDIFATAYAAAPEWINDAFFLRSLEPGVIEMLRDTSYAQSVRNSPVFARNRKGVAIARQNLLLIYQAGIRICLGTDSGALPIRAQGFAEHLEMEKMVEAGLPVSAVLQAATKNGSTLLGTANQSGSIRKGMDADLLVLAANPLSSIRNLRQIDMVCRKGVLYLSKNATP